MLCTILEKQTSLDRVNQTFALSPRGGCEHQTTLDAGSRCWRPTCTAYIACAPRALVCGDGCGVVPDIRERSLSLGKSCVSQVKVKSGREGGREGVIAPAQLFYVDYGYVDGGVAAKGTSRGGKASHELQSSASKNA